MVIPNLKKGDDMEEGMLAKIHVEHLNSRHAEDIAEEEAEEAAEVARKEGREGRGEGREEGSMREEAGEDGVQPDRGTGTDADAGDNGGRGEMEQMGEMEEMDYYGMEGMEGLEDMEMRLRDQKREEEQNRQTKAQQEKDDYEASVQRLQAELREQLERDLKQFEDGVDQYIASRVGTGIEAQAGDGGKLDSVGAQKKERKKKHNNVIEGNDEDDDHIQVPGMSGSMHMGYDIKQKKNVRESEAMQDSEEGSMMIEGESDMREDNDGGTDLLDYDMEGERRKAEKGRQAEQEEQETDDDFDGQVYVEREEQEGLE